MANKQTVPSVNLKGVFLKDDLKSDPIPVERRREFAGNGVASSLALTADATNDFLRKRKEYEIEKRKFQIDQDLYNYRTQLNNANSPEEFMEISQGIEGDLRDKYQNDFWGKEFWNEHGEKILKANINDVEKIKQTKQVEFGKNSLNEMLALNQNMLVNANATKAKVLISSAVDEINNSVFLSDDEKKNYRDGYLKTGIVNLALNDEDEALLQAKKYFADDEKLVAEINETKRLKEIAFKRKQDEEKRQKYLNDFSKATDLWQKKASGNISDAEFFVLTRGMDKELIWGDKESRSLHPLVDAYKLVKKMNTGQRLTTDEIGEAGNHIMSAFQKNQIGAEEASSWQNQILMGQVDKSSAEFIFDDKADELADLVLMEDVEYNKNISDDGANFMEQKARLSFDIYENYYGKKMALTEDFKAMGGFITPAIERKIARQAIEETRDDLGLKQNIGNKISFAELNDLLRKHYAEADSSIVWNRFYKQAPFVENKKELFRSIASEERRKVLNYPNFDNIEEVESAGLNSGDKFYLNGRLVEIS